MRQQALVPSGCQQWIRKPATVGPEGNFAYSSALAVYVYNAKGGQVSLSKILARVATSVTSVSWDPHNPNQIALACADLSVKIFSIEDESQVTAFASKVGGKNVPPSIYWSLHDPHSIFVHAGNGLILWNAQQKASNAIRVRGAQITAFAQSKSDPNKIAIGYDDGLLYIHDLKTQKGKEIPGESRITSLAFDPLSKDYLLAVHWNGHMKLYMVADGALAPTPPYSKQPSGHRDAGFINTMPGTFVTVSDRSGVMQVWNVSKSEPMRRLKCGQAALQSVSPIAGTPLVVVTVKDGTVMVYNVQRTRVEWQTQGGHTETIFGCEFHPDDPNTLATCSYDSTIRLWNVMTQKAVNTLVGAQGVLYSVTWSPDGKSLATCSSNGNTYIFDAESGILKATHRHHKAPIYRIAWHSTESNLIASASTDKMLFVFRADGTVTCSLAHPEGICCVAWSPAERLTLVTTCENGIAYVWDLSVPSGAIQGTVKAELKGHRARVFNAAWNPLLHNLILTGSDDTCARVWDLNTNSSVELRGHTSNVRGLLWHSEMPTVCITGSWDSTIRVWNAETGACLKIVQDHHADVYGIASHRRRPFTVATTSRDTTLRLWDLSSTFPAIQLRAAALGEAPTAKAAQGVAPGTLCGTVSVAAARLASEAKSDLDKFVALFGLLSPPGGATELWDLAVACTARRNGQRGVMPCVKDPQVCHQSTVRMILNSQAQEQEMKKNARARSMGGAKKDDIIRNAAAAHLLAGNIESYCNLSSEVGDWQEALAVAPAAGLSFWQDLMRRRATQLTEEGATTEALRPFLIAAGQASHLVAQLLEARSHNEAFQVATVAAEGGYSVAEPVAKLPSMPSRNGSLSASMGSLKFTNDLSPAAVRQEQAQALLEDSQPVLAACCHLSVDDVEGALDKLRRGHEVVLAAALAQAMASPSLELHLTALARQCEISGEWRLAAQVLRRTNSSQDAIELLAARVASTSPNDTEQVYQALALQSPAVYKQMAPNSQDHGQKIRYLLLGGLYEEAANLAVSVLRESLHSPSPDQPPALGRAASVEDALMSIPAKQLPESRRNEVLAYAFYIGAIKAMQEGYNSVVPLLLQLTTRLAASVSGFPVQPDGLTAQLKAYEPKVGTEVRTTGSNIPSGASRDGAVESYVSRKRIQGPSVVLEDNKSAISLSEAVMLVHVTSFSPLATGDWLLV